MATPAMTEASALPRSQRVYRYYDFVMAAFVTVLICSNLIGAGKACQVSVFGYPFNFTAGVLFFPISYIFGDILTEVYGYARARKVVWAGFTAQIFVVVMANVVIWFPPAPGWQGQREIEAVFGGAARIVGASLLAYFCGEFVNSYVLAKLKIKTAGRFLWMRTIGSTIAGEGVDSLIFYPVAFYGLWDTSLVLKVMMGNYLLKVAWEVINTPLTYRVVAFLKRAEHEDYYDRNTNFTPFSIQT